MRYVWIMAMLFTSAVTGEDSTRLEFKTLTALLMSCGLQPLSVLTAMISTIGQFKIVRSVISAISVFVMDNFCCQERSAQKRLHDLPVAINLFSADGFAVVAVTIKAHMGRES